MIKFKCSKCNEDLEAPTSMVGDRLQCPTCKFPEIIPDQEPAPDSIAVDGFYLEEEDNTPITLFPQDTKKEEVQDSKFKRSLMPDSPFANRIRTFHARLSDKAIEYMDEQINEWLDKHPEINIKFTNTTVGIVEGKKNEPHLIVSIWY